MSRAIARSERSRVAGLMSEVVMIEIEFFFFHFFFTSPAVSAAGRAAAFCSHCMN